MVNLNHLNQQKLLTDINLQRKYAIPINID